MDWNAIAALAGLAAAIVAIVALFLQSRQTAFAIAVDLLLKMDERFDSPEMLRRRQCAARGLLNGSEDNVRDVLNYFELVGLLMRRKALDRAMVWHDLSYWITQYADAARDYINAERHKDPNLWTELLWLDAQMLDIERSHRPRGSIKYLEKRVDFLRKEASLHLHAHAREEDLPSPRA
jgi:hypothetical protein